MDASKNQFAMDVQALRKRAREHMEQGAVTADYRAEAERTVALLNTALSTELLCILRYKFHAVTATGIDSKSVREEFLEHAKDETEHADQLAERIAQLGGKPDFNPEHISRNAHTEYIEGKNLIDMIKEDLVAERIAVESYRDLVKYFQDRDPTTKRMLESILAKEEEHANDMHDLLVAHEGQPMLPR